MESDATSKGIGNLGRGKEDRGTNHGGGVV